AVGDAQGFNLRAVQTLPAGSDPEKTSEFQVAYVAAARRLEAVNETLNAMDERVQYLRKAMDEAPGASADLHLRLDEFAADVDRVRTDLNGNQAQQAMSEFTAPGVASRIRSAGAALDTRVGPTRTQQDNLRMGTDALGGIESRVRELRDVTLKGIEQALSDAGAPWTPGQPVGAR
ncbi:MAG: hypothetical protein QNJ00_07050, partial [Woeseiaceae bacterium]|nr:hypothetical protein [Woeseiaceae bacterium]